MKKDQTWFIIQMFGNKKFVIFIFFLNQMIKYLFHKMFEFQAKTNTVEIQIQKFSFNRSRFNSFE